MKRLSGAVQGRGSDGAWYLQATSDLLTVRRRWQKTWHNRSETKDVIFPKSHGGYGRTRDGHLDLNGMGEGWLCYRSPVLGLGDPQPSMGSRSKLALCRGGESPHPLRPPAANPALSSGLCGEQSGPRILFLEALQDRVGVLGALFRSLNTSIQMYSITFCVHRIRC